MPMSLFKILVEVLIKIASFTNLWWESGQQDRIETVCQSTGCPSVQACSARADELKSAPFTALLCSSRR